MFEKEERIFIVRRCFSQYVPVGSSNGFLATPPVFLPQTHEMFALSPKKLEKTLYLKRTFFSSRSSGMIECSFDKRPIFPQKVWKWQNGWSNFRRKFRKMFLWTTNMPLRERSQKFWPMSELYSLEVWKTKKKFLKDLVLLKMFLRPQRTEIGPHC